MDRVLSPVVLRECREDKISPALQGAISGLQDDVQRLSGLLDSVLFRQVWRYVTVGIQHSLFNGVATEARFSQQVLPHGPCDGCRLLLAQCRQFGHSLHRLADSPKRMDWYCVRQSQFVCQKASIYIHDTLYDLMTPTCGTAAMHGCAGFVAVHDRLCSSDGCIWPLDRSPCSALQGADRRHCAARNKQVLHQHMDMMPTCL